MSLSEIVHDSMSSGLATSTTNRPSGFGRMLRVAVWIVAMLLSAQICLRTIPAAWRTLNTDFPNYYLTARLLHERFDASRIYEWIWLQRQKDHREIDQRIVGMVPITPFSTLAVYPLASLPPLVAKHYWLVFNIGLLFGTLLLLRSLTGLRWRWVALITSLSVPLRVNFLYGQYYVLLLFLLTLSCWLYVRRRGFSAGFVVGLAAGLKVFPILFVPYFLRKREPRAFAGGVAGSLSTVAISVIAFGWDVHRTYFSQILPSVFRGEGLDPYNLRAASLSSLLHRLFIYEPQLNQHPGLNAPWLFAVLHPLLQMTIIAPALLLCVPGERSARQVRLEWAALLTASTAMSTSASSYLLTILILPVCLLLEELEQLNRYISIIILLALYISTSLLEGSNEGHQVWVSLFAVPRLYALLLLCVLGTSLLNSQRERSRPGRNTWAWAMGALVVLSMASSLHHLQGLYADYQWRLPAAQNVYMAVDPIVQNDAILFVAMMPDGYHTAIQDSQAIRFSPSSRADRLSVTADTGDRWEEQTGTVSTLISSNQGRTVIQRAESPIVSLNGRRLAFLREECGRARLWVRSLDQPTEMDRPITPPELNVLEMTFTSDGDLIFAATSGTKPSLFFVDQRGNIRSLGVDAARYPSASPDGNWLAYSALSGGAWNLWLRSLVTGQTERLTNVSCNNIDPAWTADSQTLIYASDCGRALWFTAICKRRIFR